MLETLKHKLHIDLQNFYFVTRETDQAGRSVIFRCNRDFLYNALQYFKPEKYRDTHPQQLEGRILGVRVPYWNIWIMLHMKTVLKDL